MKGIKKIDENLITPDRSLTITNYNLLDNKNWQPGTLKCDTRYAGLSYKVANNQPFSFFDARYTLQPGTIIGGSIKDDNSLIAHDTIKTVNLTNGCITNDKVYTPANDQKKKDPLAIDGNKLQYKSITAYVIGPECIYTGAIQGNAIASYHLQNGSVIEDAIAPDAVTANKIKNGEVGTTKLANSAVTNVKVAPGEISNLSLSSKLITEGSGRLGPAVDWYNIKSYSIAGGEMAEYELNGQIVMHEGLIAHKTITNWNIAERTINTECMMNGAVTNRVIGQYEVYGDVIAPQAIKSNHIENETITSVQIAEKGITTENYADYSITKIKLDNEIINVVDNAVIYDEEGNVTMLKAATCNVAIGSEDVNGNSNGNGYLRVYGDIKADRVYNMSYSDLAEGYIPGEKLESGDIVELREDGKVYKAFNNDTDSIVVGVVSDEFATCYGATKEEIEAGEKVAVGLIGKVHVKVNGPVKIGESIRIGNIPGVGALWSTSNIAVGKALETSKIDGVHKVLCLIKPF